MRQGRRVSPKEEEALASLEGKDGPRVFETVKQPTKPCKTRENQYESDPGAEIEKRGSESNSKGNAVKSVRVGTAMGIIGKSRKRTDRAKGSLRRTSSWPSAGATVDLACLSPVIQGDGNKKEENPKGKCREGEKGRSC